MEHETAPRLSSSQLCDLLNYVLGMPIRLGTKTIIKPAIGAWVVTSWRKRVKRQTEAWLERQLRDAKVIEPFKDYRGGPRRGSFAPRELQQWIPGRAA